MMDELLIQLVYKHPVLYDLCHPKYMDTVFKNNIWTSIAAEIGADGHSCKTRWSNIRDNYRKSLKKTKSGLKRKPVKRYKYSEQLKFLTDYFEDRMVKDNSDKVDEEYCEPASEDIEEKPQVNLLTGELQSHFLSPPDEKPPFDCPSLRKRSRSLTPNTMPAMQYLVKSESMDVPSSSQHAVDAFLMGIAPVLKQLPPHYWHYAKADIFAAVQKYELKMLMDQEPYQESTSVLPEQPSHHQ